ncbi:MAG: multidrug effflux MFS transporter [Alphaproteobacteria bacterium]|nr:multidrug effflux MFS transporter [Alphaproteobacteria bacterium]
MNKKPHITSPTEFVLLMAAMMSLVSLTIDAMLPAFNAIAVEFQLTNPNDIQLIIAVVFVGMSCGIFIYGPLADSYGRKKVCYFALCLFAIGTILSIIAQDYTTMLIGRFIQGFGIAAPRVLAFTMVRDKFDGVMVAKISSFIIMVFIAMPAIAPALGQLILLFSGWRMIFVAFLVLTFIVTCWYAWRQEETLHPEHQRPFSIKSIMQAVREVFANKKTVGYSIALGLMFAGFLNYLNSTQQIFQNQYDTGTKFPLYFATIALFFGISSLVNTRLVDKIEMKQLSIYSFTGIVIVSAIFLVVTIYGNGSPPLWSLMIFLYITAFCAGILIGNLNSMAILPMGHLAGMASSVIAAVSTLISVLIGTMLSQLYDGTLYSLVGGYLLTCIIGLIITHRTNKIL